MDVNNAERSSSVQATLDLPVVRVPVVGIEGASEVVVEEELPSHRNAEGVHAVIFGKVLHLVDAELARVDCTAHLASSIYGAAEVKAGDLIKVDG